MKLPFSLEQVVKAQAYQKLYHFIEVFWKNLEARPFVGNWHLECICEHLEAVSRGEIRRLIINIPPRHTKSLTTSVFWPAWSWLHSPEVQWLFASYGQNLSTRDSIKCRRILESPEYIQMCRDFGGRDFYLVGDQNTKTRYDNVFGGYRLATSVGGALTGEGGDIVAIDDAHNVIQGESTIERANVVSWWDEAMSTRLNDPKKGAYVLIMQRVHEEDIIGHILSKDTEHKWEHLCIPARYEGFNRIVTSLGWKDKRTVEGELLWPERFGEKEMNELEISLGTYAAAAQLQQRPAPREGGLLKSQWFVQTAPELVPKSVDRRVRFWDLAATEGAVGKDPDYTSGALVSVKNGVYYIENITRLRGSPLKVENLIVETAENDPENTLIYMEQEPGASGVNVIDHYSREVLNGFPFRGLRSTGSKEKYVETVAAAMEAGNVRVIKGEWNRAFFQECDMFPNGKHDDMVDSVAKAFSLLRKSKRVGAWGRNRKNNTGDVTDEQ